MKNWVKSLLATTAWLAVILFADRFLLPWLDVLPAEHGFIRLLSRLTPALMLVFFGSILALWINSIYQRRLARKYDPRAQRIMAEAQQWSDVFYFDEELGETVSPDRSAAAAAASQPEVELSYGALASIPGVARKQGNKEPQAEIVNKNVSSTLGLSIGQSNGQKNSPAFEDKNTGDLKNSASLTSNNNNNNNNNDIEQVLSNKSVGKTPVKPQVNLLPPPLAEFTGRKAEL